MYLNSYQSVVLPAASGKSLRYTCLAYLFDTASADHSTLLSKIFHPTNHSFFQTWKLPVFFANHPYLAHVSFSRLLFAAPFWSLAVIFGPLPNPGHIACRLHILWLSLTCFRLVCRTVKPVPATTSQQPPGFSDRICLAQNVVPYNGYCTKRPPAQRDQRPLIQRPYSS